MKNCEKRIGGWASSFEIRTSNFEIQLSSRAWCPRLHPLPSCLDKLGVRERRQRAHRSIRSPSRIPGPEDERLLLVMLQQMRSIELTKNRAANVGTGQRVIVRVLPFHRKRSEMPVVAAGHSGAVGIRRLMARGAIQRDDTLVLRASNDVRKVAMTIIALLRIIRRGVAVDAAGIREDRIDLVPRGEAVGRGGGAHP